MSDSQCRSRSDDRSDAGLLRPAVRTQYKYVIYDIVFPQRFLNIPVGFVCFDFFFVYRMFPI